MNVTTKNKEIINEIIPKEWEVKKFKDITDVLKCGIASTPKYTKSGIPFLSSQNVKENKILLNKYSFISEEYHKKLTKKILPRKGDILYTRVGASFGKAALVDFDWEFSVYVSLTLIRIKEYYDANFIVYLLNSNEYQRNAKKLVFQGGGVPNLNVKEVEKFNILVPPIDEQEKIVKIISTWDRAIELKQHLINLKKEQKKDIMQNLLSGKVRFPEFNEKWKEIKLKKVIKKVKGKTINYSDTGRIPCIDMEYFETNNFKNYTNESSVSAEKTDVLLLWDGSRAGKSFTGVKGAVGSTFVKLVCKGINNYYLQSHMEMNEIKIQRIREGSSIPHVPKDFLDYYKVDLPSLDEQTRISNTILSFNNQINFLEQELEALKEQKKGLMQQLLTGKTRVKV